MAAAWIGEGAWAVTVEGRGGKVLATYAADAAVTGFAAVRVAVRRELREAETVTARTVTLTSSTLSHRSIRRWTSN